VDAIFATVADEATRAAELRSPAETVRFEESALPTATDDVDGGSRTAR
jgi:hypothetical protein